VLTTLALQRTTSAHAAVIAAGLPIATAVFAVLRGGERPPRAFWVASVVGTVAVVVFALSRGGGVGEDLLADALMIGAVLLAALGYAEGALLTKHMPGWQVVSWTLVVCLPVTLPVGAVALHASMQVRTPTPASWVGLLYLALFSMYLGFFAWYRGLADLGVARGSQVQLLQPLLTLLWSVLLLGETVGLDTLAAALVVLGAVAWTQRTRAPAEVEATD
jgi:drug/metabolite transporter (DMT)-like permease